MQCFAELWNILYFLANRCRFFLSFYCEGLVITIVMWTSSFVMRPYSMWTEEVVIVKYGHHNSKPFWPKEWGRKERGGQ